MAEKINFKQPLVDFYGKPLPGDATLLTCCINALSGAPDSDKLTGEQKMKRWRLGCKIAKAEVNGTGEVALKADDVLEILKCTDQAFQPIVAGCVRAMLDPSEEDAEFLELIKPPPALHVVDTVEKAS